VYINAKNLKNIYNESAITIANTMKNKEIKKILERSYIGILFYKYFLCNIFLLLFFIIIMLIVYLISNMII